MTSSEVPLATAPLCFGHAKNLGALALLGWVFGALGVLEVLQILQVLRVLRIVCAF